MRRMHRVVPALMLILAFMLVSLHDRSIAKKPESKAVVQAINSLALDLYPKLKQGDANLFFSPYSISSALAMTYAGARGSTATQMAKTLHFSGDRQNVDEGFGVLNQALADSADREGCQLDVANALWAQKGFPFIPEFRALILNAYHGEFNQVDFVKAPEVSRKTINKAVEKQTHGKIFDLMPAGSINKLTNLVLTNAIYFECLWAKVFKEKDTKAEEFTLLNGSKTQVPMMQQETRFGYAAANGLQILELPYKGHEFSLLVFLPKEHDGLEQFEQSLTSEKLHNLAGRLQRTKVKVWLPKFKIDTPSYQLASILGDLGMTDAFTGKADFSAIDGRQDLFLQAVLHKAFVNVDEKGTEAAAATAIGVGSVALREAPPVFRADHPFLFVIRHNPTKCILFMGRLTKP